MRALGIEITGEGTEVVVRGKGLDGLRVRSADLDAGNSGSTIRMLSGILAAQPFPTRIFGDDSLSRRPMQRIMQPLAEMGAQIRARDGKFPPRNHGAKLRAIDYAARSSAQVNHRLFAGLFAGETSVTELGRSQNCPAEIQAELTVAKEDRLPASRAS
jgi:3-phosphoshikimate 1-carboxyvinyltransferase